MGRIVLGDARNKGKETKQYKSIQLAKTSLLVLAGLGMQLRDDASEVGSFSFVLLSSFHYILFPLT